jgi:hypothetical protein
MAEILKAESYTSVMKTAHEDVYTLFIEAEVVDENGQDVIRVLGDGASVGAYSLSVQGNIYTLVFNPPAGFRGEYVEEQELLPVDPKWSFLGAPTVALVYPDAEIGGGVVVPQILEMNFNLSNELPYVSQSVALPYINFIFWKRTGTVTPVLSSVLAPIGSKIQVTMHYTTSDKK